MGVKVIIEFNEQRRIVSLDDFTKSFLQAIQRIVRQELEQVLAARPVANETRTPAPETNRPVLLSKIKAAQALGVSVRTIDNCIAQQRIRVVRIGRRVLVPMDSIEAALKHGALETRPGE